MRNSPEPRAGEQRLKPCDVFHDSHPHGAVCISDHEEYGLIVPPQRAGAAVPELGAQCAKHAEDRQRLG